MLPIIQVNNISKQYRVGGSSNVAPTLREALLAALKVPFNGRNGKPANGADLFWAVNNINFEVHPGEIVGIIGRNGAGKSTLLKIISRIIKPTRGEVNIYGRVGSLLEIGTGFHPDLSGRENINFEVHPGEIVGIIGRNGAGKSTLLEIISRIIKPTRGEVNIYGRVGSLLETG